MSITMGNVEVGRAFLVAGDMLVVVGGGGFTGQFCPDKISFDESVPV